MIGSESGRPAISFTFDGLTSGSAAICVMTPVSLLRPKMTTALQPTRAALSIPSGILYVKSFLTGTGRAMRA